MKKKLIIPITATVICLALVAYIFNNSKISKMYEFVNLLESGHYYLDGSYILLGLETPIEIAVDGNNFDVEAKTFIGSTRIIYLDNQTYILNNNDLTISIATESEEDSGLTNIVIDYNNYSKTGDGESKIPYTNDDTIYEYYEYMNNETDSVIRYYFKDNELYCIHTMDTLIENILIINELTKNIPEDRLSLPKGYKEI